MIEPPEIADTTAQRAAVIRLQIPRERIGVEMPAAIQELLDALSAQGQAPQGPLFAHHLKLSKTDCDVEVGFPVGAPIAPAGRVDNGAQPGGRVARTVYQGPYEDLPAAWDAFGQRLRSDGLASGEVCESVETLWERYLVGPETSDDPGDWRTELNLPLDDARES
ncbi:MAG: GyrI-like domain-containing protein [Dichotomicrobium sp.]